MSTTTLAPPVARSFPTADVEILLRRELEKVADTGAILHPWEPHLDSFSIIPVVSKLEEFLGCRLPPDKVIKKGGYPSVEEGVKDMTEKVRRICPDRQKKKKGGSS